VESNWVHSALRPPIDLLCQPQVIMMMEKLVEWWLARETEVLEKKPAPVPLCPPQTPHSARTRTRAAAVGSQQLTAWATARPAGPHSNACRSKLWSDIRCKCPYQSFFVNLICYCFSYFNIFCNELIPQLIPKFFLHSKSPFLLLCPLRVLIYRPWHCPICC
jgi:hypothetical protein